MTNSPSINPVQHNCVNWRVNDFCLAHGIGRTSFYENVKNGDLKVFKIGSTTLIADVEAKAWQARKVAA